MKRIRVFAMLWSVVFMVTGAFSTAIAAGEPATTSLVVKLVNGLSPVEQAAVIARNGGVETSSVPALRLHILNVPDNVLSTTLQSYQSDPQVESVELNKIRKAEGIPGDLNYGVQWALSKIGWESVFGTVTPSGSAKLAILDTGIDASHPDLAGNIISGTSILDGTNGLSDPNGHGTSLAGIVAALTDNGEGIAGIGYAGVRIMPVTVLRADGTGQDSDIITGIIWAADQGADVILMGFSNPDYSQNLQDAIDYAWSKGAVLVAATGNNGVSTPTFPAGARGVVGVSATDETDLLATGSNFGLDTFLAAPGTNIYTTSLGGSYTYITGTSASSAIVAGVAGFMKAADPTLANGVIVGRLAKSADAIGTIDDPNIHIMFGNGRVNMANALAEPSSDVIQPAGAAPVGSGGPYIGPYIAAAVACNKISFITSDQTLLAGQLSAKITVEARRSNNSNSCSISNATVNLSSSSSSKTFYSDAEGTNAITQVTLSGSPNKNEPHAATFYYRDMIVGSPEITAASSGLTSGVQTEKIIDKVATTTGLSSSANPSNSGDGVSFTATVTVVSPGTGTPTGTVQFKVNGSDLGTPVTLAGGSATSITTSTLALGDSNITAVYNGDTNFNTSTSATLTQTVSKAPATVTLGNLSTTYDGTPKTVTSTTTPSELTVNFTYNGSATAPTNAGSYTVVGTVSDSNYQGSSTGTLVINPAPITVTADAQTKDYGGVEPALTYHITSGSLVTGDAFTGSLIRLAGENVGTYAIQQGTLALNGNYALTFAGTNLTITPRPVTMTADAKSKTYGQADPALTYQITGGSLVAGDAFTGSLNRVAGENVGTYAIQQGTLGAGANYSIAYTSANLAISKADQTIMFTALANKTDSDAPFTVSATASSNLLVNFSAAGNCSVSGASVTIDGAGSCTVTASQGGDTNYNAATNVLQSFTISASGTAVSPGTNILVTPTPGVQLTFSSVSSGGSVTAIAISNPAAPPANFKLSGSAYEITNTAGFAGQVTVCINYNPANLFNPANASKLKLWHHNGSSWQDITYGPVNTTAHKVCGLTSSFSPFAVVEPTAYTITTTAGAHGSIDPSGPATVDSGAGKTFAINPATGYVVQYVVVDGINLGALASFDFTNVTADHTISAGFTPQTFTITATAGANGSISPAGDSTVNYGTGKTYTITPAAGYHVATLTVDGQSVPAATSYTFANVTSGPRTIAATFAENPHATIAASVVGGNGSISPASADVPAGTSPIFTMGADAGFRVADVLVDGVSKGAVTSFTFTNVTAGNHTIVASFKADNFTITATATPNGTITPLGATTVARNGGQSYAIAANTGYVIQYVVVDGVNKGALASYDFTNVTADHTISVGFTPQTFTITATAGANGSISPAGDSTVNYGTGKTYTITPAAGYHVATLTVDGQPETAATSYTFANVTSGPRTIAATFAENPHATIAASVVGGNGSISPASADVPAGTSPIFTMGADAGFRVADVLVDGVSKGAVTSFTFTNVTAGNHTIVASFKADNFTITATATPNGTITPLGATTVARNGGQSYAIAANTGYVIQYVVVDGVNKGALASYDFTNVTADHTISVGFTPQTFTITATAGANGSISPAGDSTVNYGTGKTYTITPAAGYHVATLTVDGQPETAATSYTFANVTSGPRTIAATFAENPHATIAASVVGGNGTISPASADVPAGTSPIFTMGADAGFRVADVLVDGVSKGAVTSFTFTNVTAGNHTIVASFKADNFTITATATPNGTITPLGATTVARNGGQSYAIAANTGYVIQYVVVDGVNKGALASYDFTNVTADHTISVGFTPQTFTITATAGANGSISPAGDSTVNYGTGKTYTITPAAGYHVATLTVDGQPETAATSYTFANVTSGPRTIAATFAENPHATIAASVVGGNGSISPASADVPAGTSQTFTFGPAPGFVVGSVLVDGAPVAAANNYTFNNVTAGAHTISVSFVSNSSFTITATAGANGSISPPGATTVSAGGSQTYTITPAPNYRVSYVLVKGVNKGAITSYTFDNVQANQDISAAFVAITYTITVTQSANGSISPSTSSTIPQGINKTYTITPATGYHVDTVTVDDQPATPATSYTFPNVHANHKITATFAPNPLYTITASVGGTGAGGSISPAGVSQVQGGLYKVYTISPLSGYKVEKVLVDGVNKGAVTSYTFYNVNAGHTIVASFIPL